MFEIRRRIAAGEALRAIARDYPVNESAIGHIKNGRNWRFPPCAAGCGDLVERQGSKCYACASDEARRLDIAARRELIANR